MVLLDLNKIYIFRIDRSSMIHNIRPYVRPSGTYNLPNRNRYEKSVITKSCAFIKISATKIIFSKHFFFGLEKIVSRKTRFFLNPNRSRYEILVKTKKFRLDVTISKKQEKFKNTLFFGLEKSISRKTLFF